ncbi:MAG: cytochrome C oxidase subunit IV family protein [Planctomycetaceae bacterium]|nr:cytochrome C oxidase subunit IV family protein [Planctomycetaceae bacterium]
MSDNHDEHGFAHVMSPQILLSVFGALIVLTILTVFLAGKDLVPRELDGHVSQKQVEIVVSLTIATIKGSLVVLFFMHMINEKPLNILLFVFSLFFVALFLGFALTDTGQYDSRIQSYELDIIEQSATP